MISYFTYRCNIAFISKLKDFVIWRTDHFLVTFAFMVNGHKLIIFICIIG